MAAQAGKGSISARAGAGSDWPEEPPPVLLAVFSKTCRTRYCTPKQAVHCPCSPSPPPLRKKGFGRTEREAQGKKKGAHTVSDADGQGLPATNQSGVRTTTLHLAVVATMACHNAATTLSRGFPSTSFVFEGASPSVLARQEAKRTTMKNGKTTECTKVRNRNRKEKTVSRTEKIEKHINDSALQHQKTRKRRRKGGWSPSYSTSRRLGRNCSPFRRF